MDAFRGGKLTLANFAGERTSPRWGRTGYQRSGKGALVDAGIPIELRRLREPSNQEPMPPLPPPSSDPNRPASPRQTAEIEEARIRSIADHEEAVLIDSPSGAVVWRKGGQATSVGFTALEMAQMPGRVLTHNHPRGWSYPETDPRRAGNSFSPDDVALFVRSHLAEMRAVSPLHVFTLRPPDPNNHSPEAEHYRQVISRQSADRIFQEFNTYNVVVRQRLGARILDPTDPFTAQDAEATHYHEVLTLIAQDWGVEYERKEWTP